MWWIFLFFVIGIALGFFVSEKIALISEKAVNITVYFLLILLGINVGGNSLLMSSMKTIGINALILAVGGIGGSVVFALVFEKLVFRDKFKHTENLVEENGDFSPFKGSAIVLLSFVFGIVLGYYGLLPFNRENNNTLIQYVLYFLLLFVGISIGSDKKALKFIKKAGKRSVMFPLFTVGGTLLGSVIAVLFVKGITLGEAAAVGSGFGYYSLSSVIIAEIKNDTIATIALIANIVREVFTLAFAPLIAAVFGKFGIIASGGATSMDTTLPVVVRFSGKNYAVISVFHGIVLTILVPFLVSFFAKF